MLIALENTLNLLSFRSETPYYTIKCVGLEFQMDSHDVSAAQEQGILVTTTTDVTEYELTDCQESNTASIQSEYVSGQSIAFTL
jgi:hypothetical protein